MGTQADRETGTPGVSAEREYQRRRHARRARVRDRYGLLGSAFVSLLGEPRHVYAWRQGAVGEQATANALHSYLNRTDVIVLHDRRIPSRGRWNIDHLAIGPGGVTVIDTKSSHGRVELGHVGFIHKEQALFVNGRNRTAQLDALERQIDRVYRALDRAGVGDVSVLGALCFPFMHRPWLHYSRARDGLIRVDDPAHIAKLANRPGLMSIDEIDAITDLLERAFPPA